jgi:hypothetical protein
LHSIVMEWIRTKLTNSASMCCIKMCCISWSIGDAPSIGQVQYSMVQYSTVQYSTVQYSTVQYSTVHYHAVLCSALSLYHLAVTLTCSWLPTDTAFSRSTAGRFPPAPPRTQRLAPRAPRPQLSLSRAAPSLLTGRGLERRSNHARNDEEGR